MKTLKALLIVAATTATFSLMAGEPAQSPRASGVRHPVTAESSAKDPNLIANAKTGKSTAEAVATAGVQDPNIAAAIANCTMAPKTKDTATCKKHCEAMASK